MKIFTREEVVQKLKNLQGDRTVAEYAKYLSVSYPHLNAVYNQGAPIGKKLREFLGLKREVTKTVTYFELNGKRKG
jgi:hypothetical protein